MEQQLLALTGFVKECLPMKYLRVPLIVEKLSFHDCGPIIERINNRLVGLKSRPLSYVSSLVLIKVVTCTGPVFLVYLEEL